MRSFCSTLYILVIYILAIYILAFYILAFYILAVYIQIINILVMQTPAIHILSTYNANHNIWYFVK